MQKDSDDIEISKSEQNLPSIDNSHIQNVRILSDTHKESSMPLMPSSIIHHQSKFPYKHRFLFFSTSTWIYPAAIIINFIIRFSWILRVFLLIGPVSLTSFLQYSFDNSHDKSITLDSYMFTISLLGFSISIFSLKLALKGVDLGLKFLEVFRRWLWVFLRIEREWVSNMYLNVGGEFRGE